MKITSRGLIYRDAGGIFSGMVFLPEKGESGLVVGSLMEASISGAEVAWEDCDLVELRLDGWTGDLSPWEFAQKCSLPVLVTARDHAEGGRGSLSVQERVELLRSHLKVAQAVDVELRNLEAMSEIWEEAGALGLLRVASAHDFEKPFSLEKMEQGIERAIGRGAEVVKFAFWLNEREDMEAGLSLFKENFQGNIGISVMGMGEWGAESRVLFGKNGSVLNYGYLGTAETAPGQLPARELKRLLSQKGEG